MKPQAIRSISAMRQWLVSFTLVIVLLGPGRAASAPAPHVQVVGQIRPAPGIVLAPTAIGWNALGKGVHGDPEYETLNAVVVSGSDVYVGGEFITATNADDSTVTANHIARWDGATWSALGKGVNGNVRSLALNGNELIVGGSFTTATNADDSTVTVNNIARWNGSSWSAFGKGVDNGVTALAVSGGNIYAGGIFIAATNTDDTVVEVDGVARWNGSSWSALGKGVRFDIFHGDVAALAAGEAGVYVGGNFTAAVNADNSSVPANGIVRWTGSAWAALGKGLGAAPWAPAQTYALGVSGSDVYVGGPFLTVINADDSIVTVNHIAKWNGSTWSALGKGTQYTESGNQSVSSLVVNGSDVVVGGLFELVTNSDDSIVAARNIARWNGSTWSALSKGVNYWVNGIAIKGGSVVAVGWYDSATNGDDSIVQVDHVARYGFDQPFQMFVPLIRK